MKKEINQYVEDSKIEFHNLHINYRDNAELFATYGEMWAEAEKLKDLKRRFLNQNIRENPDDYGLKNPPPEAGIKSVIESDKDYIELCYEVRMLEVAKETFRQRQRSLDGLIKLHTEGYYSGEVPEEARKIQNEVKKEKQEESQNKQREGMSGSKIRLRRKKGD
jgi:hypothetical protein